MNKDLFSLINEKLPSFSKGHKLIANYILAHYDKAAFMTAQKLGKTVGVSESTVVRFATMLGCDGYPGLQRSLQDLMRSRLTAVQRIEVTSGQMNGDDVLDRVLNLDIDRIRRTLEVTSKTDFNRAVDQIISCNTIYIMGARSSAALAEFLGYYLSLVFPRVKIVPSITTSELFERIMHIDERDVMIGISFPRYSRQTVKALDFAKHNGAKVIAVTDSASSPIASLINALIVAVSIKNVDKVSATFERLEQVWDEYDVYTNSEEEGQ